uniref:G-protein coupled receptors family 1 profile domain-containing protein n=1 Tax=Romanomermis culicivorax TaxID=13658 RepID=A0A915KN69_ROMCU
MCENDSLIAYYCDSLYRNESSELMENCYLEQCFIPKRVPYALSVPLTTVYTFIFGFGLAGNFLTSIAILFSKDLLATTTAKYLLNLAIADMITLISGIPFESGKRDDRGNGMVGETGWSGKRDGRGKGTQSKEGAAACALETTYYVSALTILAFAFERYLAICHVLFIRKIVFYQQHLDKLLISCWILAILSSIPYAINHKTDYLVDKWLPYPDYGPLKSTKVCMLPLMNNDMETYQKLKLLFHGSAFVYFLLPFFVISVLYWRIQKNSRSRMMDGHSRRWVQRLNSNKDAKPHKKGIQILNFLVSVVAVFFTCYAPFQAQRLIFFYIDDPQLLPKINEYLYIISGILFYLSGVLNPFLYNLISPKYRHALQDIFRSKSSSIKLNYETAL